MDGPDRQLMELLSTRRYSPSDDSKIVDRELLSSESTHPADPQVAKSSLDDRRSASSDTFGEEQSALTTSMGGLRSKPTRKAGRPRLDGPGEAVLPEDRRIQVRRAQKTYRLKKEAMLESYKARVTELEQKISQISETFDNFYDTAFKSNLNSTHPALSSYLDEMHDILKLTDHQRKKSTTTSQASTKTDKTVFRSRRTQRICEPDPGMIFGYDISGELKTNDVNEANKAEEQHSETLEENGSHRLHAVGIEANNGTIVGRSQDGYDIERPFGNYFKYTNCFRESTFFRRLHRYCLEYAFLLYIDPRSPPRTIYRVFRLVPCIRDREKMYPFFKALVHGNIKGRLEPSGLPFYTIGGAGTHYPIKDNLGNPIYPSKMRLPRRILHVLPTGDDISGHNNVSPECLETFGLGGQWFNCTDVEGYLREQGVNLEGSSVFAEVYDSTVRHSPAKGNCATQKQKDIEDDSHISKSYNASTRSPILQRPTKRVRFDDPQEDIPSPSQLSFEDTQMRTPLQQTYRSILDIESFFNRLLRGVVILGRAPGFRRNDVEDAFKRSLLRQQSF